MRQFPDDFLWGSATAAHQVEGGCTNNDWWAWEHTPGSTAVEPSGDAIDQLSRYDEDFALLAALGQNAHRISLEWSRIEPAPGQFSQAALDHYARVLDSLARYGLTAFVTLHHFTLPQWFDERGGWLAADAVEVFARYVSVVAEVAKPGRIYVSCEAGSAVASRKVELLELSSLLSRPRPFENECLCGGLTGRSPDAEPPRLAHHPDHRRLRGDAPA